MLPPTLLPETSKDDVLLEGGGDGKGSWLRGKQLSADTDVE